MNRGILRFVLESRLSFWVDAYLFSRAVFTFKGHKTINLCKQGIITTDANILAGMDGGSALTDKILPAETNSPP